MQFTAKARYIRYSPFKLRSLVDEVRGKSAQHALDFLATCALKKAVPVRKLVSSVVANAKDLQNIEPQRLTIKDIRVDQGPTYRYYKPGAMGRSNAQRKRFSHLSIIVEPVDKKED